MNDLNDDIIYDRYLTDPDDRTDYGVPIRSVLPQRSPPASFGSDLTAFPASVQRHLDQAAGMMRRQEQPPQAISALQAAATELARSSPEMFALCVAAQMGAQGLTFEEQHMTTTATTDDRYLLGVRIGRNVRTVTSTDVKRRTIRFS